MNMISNENHCELLSPAGSLEAFYGVVNKGCDAVYFGGKKYSARSYASNFSIEDMKEAVAYAKPRGVRCYLTLNTLVKENEMKGLYDYLVDVVSTGIDAVIVQDLGLARMIAKHFKGLEIHGSTQMSVHSSEGAQFLKDIGFTRVVLARELNLQEIKEITDNVDIEVECFIHGALCYSYSGQCLMSSMIGGRSGNRGRCAQPCRLTYDVHKNGEKITKASKHLMSLKDMNTIELVPELIEAGIHSFKIEGRMKSVEYASKITATYRRYMDDYLNTGKNNVIKQDYEDMMLLFNRGGFSKGYYKDKDAMIDANHPKHAGVLRAKVIDVKGNMVKVQFNNSGVAGDGFEIRTGKQPHPGFQLNQPVEKNQQLQVRVKDPKGIKKGDLIYCTRSHSLMKSIQQDLKVAKRQMPIDVFIELKENKPAVLTLSKGAVHVTVEGPVVEKAEQNPLSPERLEKQISKLGNTPFMANSCQVSVDDNVFIPMGVINQLRRDAVSLLEEKLSVLKTIEVLPYQNVSLDRDDKNERFSVSVHTMEQLKAVMSHPSQPRIYIEESWLSIGELEEMLSIAADYEHGVYLALSYIMRNKGMRRLENYVNSPVDGFLVRTYGEYYYVKSNTDKEIILDYTFNIMNNHTLEFWEEQGVIGETLSLELSQQEVEDMESSSHNEYMVYGKMPLMVTEQCIIKDQGYCKKELDAKFELEDRKGFTYTLKRNCRDCHSLIYNIQPLMLIKHNKILKKLPVATYRFLFLEEDSKKVTDILDAYYRILVQGEWHEGLVDNITMEGFTRGHLLRGVE